MTTAADYRDTALERMGDARELKRLGRYPFAMYADLGYAQVCVHRAHGRGPAHSDRGRRAMAKERTRIVFIVTDTPEEYDALKKAAV